MKHSSICYQRRRAARGQSFLIVVVFISLLLLGILGVAVDYSQIWAHRQMAQGAADAACQAAAADLYLSAVGGTSYGWVGSAFDCSTQASSAPCRYATFNGYSGSAVNVTFPSSLPGVPGLPISVAHPYVRVNVTDPVPMGLTKLLYPNGTFNISAKAGCGVVAVNQKIPLLVLNLNNASAFQSQGTSNIIIQGGPTRSIQVDSSSPAGASVGGSVDLHLAGPAGTGADFAVGGTEAKPGTPTPLNLGSTGKWVSPALPLSDPFATVAAPVRPTTNGKAFVVALGVNGCPDPTGCVEFTGGDYSACSTANNQAFLANACPVSPRFASPYGFQWQAAHLYAANDIIVPTVNNSNNFMFMVTAAGTSGGAAAQPVWSSHNVGTTFVDNGVTWKNMGPINATPQTAIFDPGLYYMGTTGLQPGSNTTLRTSTAAGDGTGGVMFYFSAAGSASIGSNSGKSANCTSVTASTNTWNVSPNGCIVQYNVDGSTSFNVPSRALKCASNSPPNPAGVSNVFSGNILMGPCSGPSAGQTQDYSGGVDPTGTYAGANRGFLFFQSRTAAADGGACTGGFSGRCAILGGGGSYIFSGFAYFHKSTGATGSSCGTDMSCLTFAGGSGSSSLTLGNIVIDQLSLTGGANLQMVLNSYTSFPVLKPSLLE